jgi:hypothetical protein
LLLHVDFDLAQANADKFEMEGSISHEPQTFDSNFKKFCKTLQHTVPSGFCFFQIIALHHGPDVKG